MRLLIRSVIVSLCSMCFCMSAGAAAAAIETTTGTTDWNAVIAWTALASTALSIGSGLYTWLSNRDRVTGEKFAALEKEFNKKFNDLEKQLHQDELEITRLKGRVDALPTEGRIDGLSRAVSKVEIGLAALTAEVHAQAETVKGVRNAAESINEFLRDQNKDR